MCNNIEIEPNIEIEIAISRRYWDRGHIEIEEMKNELLRLKLILQKAFQKYWCWDWYCTKEKFKLLQYFLQAYVVNIAILLRLKHQYCKKISIELILKPRNAYGGIEIGIDIAEMLCNVLRLLLILRKFFFEYWILSGIKISVIAHAWIRPFKAG